MSRLYSLAQWPCRPKSAVSYLITPSAAKITSAGQIDCHYLQQVPANGSGIERNLWQLFCHRGYLQVSVTTGIDAVEGLERDIDVERQAVVAHAVTQAQTERREFGIGDTLTTDRSIIYDEIPRFPSEVFTYISNPNTGD